MAQGIKGLYLTEEPIQIRNRSENSRTSLPRSKISNRADKGHSKKHTANLGRQPKRHPFQDFYQRCSWAKIVLFDETDKTKAISGNINLGQGSGY